MRTLVVAPHPDDEILGCGGTLYKHFKNGDKVKINQTLAEWDPYTLPVIAEKSGTASYMDLVDGVSLAETIDDATGMATDITRLDAAFP
mgnify:CR=1 FL=1